VRLFRDAAESVTSQASTVANEGMMPNMRQIDRREWWLWSSAASAMLLLALGIASFSVPAMMARPDGSYAFFPGESVRGFMGLVLVFNVYIVYKQVQINRLRREFAGTLYTMAILDPLTNIFNRRYIMHRLQEEIARSQRQGNPLTLIALDLDGFKQVNDQYGHAIGDQVLRSFGEALQRATRGSDVVARYGGDEFLAMLPDCSVGQIRHVLDRLNGLHVKTNSSTIAIRYSVGWTDYTSGESLDDFLKRADAMLYANKRNSYVLERSTFETIHKS
jgi:diguanylate cyclase (GGDEF)-like protein